MTISQVQATRPEVPTLRSTLTRFGPDVANNFVIGAVLLGSVAVGRPIIGVIARIFYPFPPAVRRHPACR